MIAKKPFHFKSRLNIGWNTNTGRNNQGRITVFSRSSGSKRLYRVIDFKRRIASQGVVLKIFKDPRRTANAAVVVTNEGMSYMILATQNLKVGDKVFSMLTNSEFIPEGSSSLLKYIPTGSLVNSIELVPRYGAKYARSAGAFAKLFKKTSNNKSFLKLRSGWNLVLDSNCVATVGIVGDSKHWYKDRIKAGNSRKIGFRPTVRGVAKNPVDHPHGGGEGKSSGGRPSVTPWGKITKGKPTVTKVYRISRSFRVFR